MSEKSKKPRPPLEPSISDAFQELADNFREALLTEAERGKSSGDQITVDDLYTAYKRLSFPSIDSLQFANAQAVISQALKENRVIEWVSYIMAMILFFFGLGLLTLGAMDNDTTTRIGYLLSGSIVELLILLPFRFAINSRRHNIALRMLGMIIDRVDDPKKFAQLLKDTYISVVLGGSPFEAKN